MPGWSALAESAETVEDMMYHRTYVCSKAKPKCKTNLEFPVETRGKNMSRVDTVSQFRHFWKVRVNDGTHVA